MKRRSFIRRGIAAAITVPTSLTPTKGAGAPSVRVGIMDGTLGLATNPEAVRYAAALVLKVFRLLWDSLLADVFPYRILPCRNSGVMPLLATRSSFQPPTSMYSTPIA